MRRPEPDGPIRYSPSDLVTYLKSPFASFMDRLALERSGDVGGTGAARDAETPEEALVKQKGNEHERRFLERLRAEGRDVVDVALPGASLEERVAATEAALRAGRGVVYQGALRDDRLAGYSDFLVRVEEPSDLGAFSYEVWDTKLARTARPYFLLQLCAYADMLARVQGRRPREVAVVVGTGAVERYRTDDFAYCTRRVRSDFLAEQDAFDAARRPLPDPGADHGHWSGEAERILEEADHLSRVAGISSTQARRLAEAGIDTLAALARSTKAKVPRVDAAVLERLRAQARLQAASLGKERPLYEVAAPDPRDPSPRRGLALLPPPSREDIFFDMEGDPFAATDGLEYLFGACYPEGSLAPPAGAADAAPRSEGARAADGLLFVGFWGHDPAGERRAFEAFVDWAHARWTRDPAMHIYHYASYEVSALRRLMGRHGSREREVDDLLRAEAFVDLFQVVRQGVRVGARDTSLKSIERAWRPPREGGVTTAGGSVVEYERWLEERDGADWTSSAILGAIRDYNRDDCVSTAGCARFLRELQAKERIAWVAPPRRGADDEDAKGKPPEESEGARLAARLLAEVPPEGSAARAADPERWRVHELLAWLVEFHRRDAKPVWWSLFDRAKMTEEELVLDPDCLGALERTARPPVVVKRSRLLEYRFDPGQETKLRAGASCRLAHDIDQTLAIEAFDGDRGLLTLRLGPSKEDPPARLSLLPDEFVSPKAIVASIVRTVTAYAAGTPLPSAIACLLRRERPRLRGRAPGAPVLRPGVDQTEAAVEAILALDESALAVQGPPGSGKTYTAARMIAALVSEGKRVAVSSNSHRAIENLLSETAKVLPRRGPRSRIVKVGGEEDAPLITSGEAVFAKGVKDVPFEGDDAPSVVGGTAWTFSAPEAAGRFDHLFVDEAGQVSLANLLGMAPAARHIVLLGDPMQLAQPTQGTHPGESGLSSLAYVLDGRRTVPDDLGIFLAVTYRLHPDLCALISGGIYEDRLRPDPRTAARRVALPASGGAPVPREAGVVFVAVEHEGNAQESEEEVLAIREVVRALTGRTLTSADAVKEPPRPLALGDILFVAPYNLQVRRLADALGPTARVGSVDRFQGQEAPVVVLSMCASDAAHSARGLEFIFSPNRLNVAVSRARSLAVVVGSPRLARARCGSLEQMRLVNLFCRVVEAGTCS